MSKLSSRETAVLGVACVAAVLIGCSQDGPPLAEVRGEVTFYGLPAQAEILFEPDPQDGETGGRPSTAFTEPDGTFRLGYAPGRFGALTGPHHVIIKVMGPRWQETRERPAEPLKVVRLRRDVRPGSNRFHFAITY